MGLPPLYSVLRENLDGRRIIELGRRTTEKSGVPSMVISPAANTPVGIGDPEQLKNYIRDRLVATAVASRWL